MAFYISLLEFGPQLLKHDAAWIPAGIIKHDQLKKVQGGLSHVLKLYFTRLFVNPGHAGLGTRLSVFGETGLLFLKAGRIIADGEGMKQALDVKGSGGIFPLVEVANVCGMGAKSLAGYTDGGYVVDISCYNETRYHWLTNEEILEKVDVLAADKQLVSEKRMLIKVFQ